ncbi:P-loop NTPase [Sporolactobacillus terrae]|uniref:Flagellum site-determining protein YlxH n=1 Tax=Sporolactobacillus terrae TaxID=269673 RepID=A0A410D8B0_9BACL|nr:P-loop NTPase [Sporolactobacillus terrae]QAA22359.1 MinD/ParA family protein [Sporolactobacillus terrae]QAA25335.1 MinD/ParA family protein [Sporolactobacillus terrae]UAK17145.1 P-loop NTPase [Sporolactobacillus terrae]BBN98675.1 flagellum site-determining protein YlxH [Sporolactobacillus terrae]
MVNDQAENLRMRIFHEKRDTKTAQVIGIASGKGGVGKSVFCVNFSWALGELGKKVLIIDLDVGMGNIEQLMGQAAHLNIVDALQHQSSFQNVCVQVSSQVSFIAGGTGLGSLFRLNPEYLNQFITQLQMARAQYDFILFDFGAGASEDLLHFLLAVDRMILVTTPEPPAIADSYSLMKMVYTIKQDLQIMAVVNQTLDRREGMKTWRRLSSTSARFLGASPSWLASLQKDDELSLSVRRQKPCMRSFPKAGYSVQMRLLARSFLVQSGQKVFTAHERTFGDKVREYLARIGRHQR